MASLEASLKLRDQFTAVLKKIDSGLNQAAQSMSDFKNKTAGPAQALSQMTSAAASAVSRLNSSIRSGLGTVMNVVQSTTERILSVFGSFGNRISEKFNLSGLASKFTSAFSGITSKVSAVTSTIGNMFNKITGRSKKIEALDDINKQLDQLNNKKAQIQINVDKIPQVQAQIDRVDQRLQRLNQAKADIKANVTNADVAEQRLAKLDAHVKKLSDKKAVLEVEAGKLDRATKHLSDVEKQIDALNQKKIELNTSAFSSFSSKIGSAFSSAMSTAKSFGSNVASVFSSAVGHAKNFGSNLGNTLKNAFNGAKNSFQQFGNDLKSGFAGIKDSTSQATGGVKGFVAALGLMKVASMAVNVVKSSMDSAVSRFDTMQKYPKVMNALGFSAEQSQKSIDQLSDGIDGLPTKLDDIVATNQRMISVSGNIEQATQATIALNNAFLASGADADKAARGTEQYIKMLSTGKVDLTSWQTLMETMPVSLVKVANAMGFAGESAQMDLYAALNEGTITFDQFQEKLIEIGTGTGILAELAKTNSAGIATSFGNLRNAVSKGVAAVITKFDQLSQKLTGKTIAEHLDGFKGKINGFFDSIAGVADESGNRIGGLMDKIPALIEKARPYLNVLKNAFNDIKAPIGQAVDAVKKSLGELTGSFGSDASVSGFQSFVTGITDNIAKLAGFVEKHSDSIAKLITMLPKVAGAIIGFKIGKGILTPFLTFGKGLTTVVGATGKLAGNLGKTFFGMFSKGKGATSGGGAAQAATAMTSPMTTFLDTLNGFAKGASKLALVFGVILLIKEAAKAMKDVNDKVPDDMGKFGAKLANMGIALVGMGTFVAVAGKLAEKNKEAAIAGLATVALISANLMLAAEAMKQIGNKVPSNMGSFAAKLGNMGIAIAGMGVLVAAAGVLAQLNPVAVIAGLAVVASISAELMLAAEAMAQVNAKVPDDIGNFATKMANIGIAIGGMGALTGILGALMATGFGGLIAAGGFVAIVAVCGEMILAAEAIAQVNAKVPDDLSDVKTKIDNIADVIGYFTEKNLGSIFDLFSNAVSFINTGMIVSNLSKFVDIGNAMLDLQTIVFSRTAVIGAVDDIQVCIDALTSGDLAGKISSLMNSALDSGTTANVAKIVNTIIGIGNSFQELQLVLFSRNAVEKTILDLQACIDLLTGGDLLAKINAFLGSGLDKGTVGKVSEIIDTLIEIGNKFIGLQSVLFSVSAVEASIRDLQTCIDLLTGGNLFDKLSNFFGSKLDNGTLTSVNKAISILIEIGQSFGQLQLVLFSVSAVQKCVEDINAVIETIGTSTLGEWFETMVKSSQLDQVKSAIDGLITVGEAIRSFPADAINTDTINAAITSVKDVIKQLNDFPEVTGTAGLEAIVDTFNSLAQQLDTFIATAQISLAGLSSVSTAFESNMTAMRSSTVTTMTEIQNAATTGMAAFNTAISTGMSAAANTARAGNAQIVSAFSGLRGQLFSAGSYAMSGLSAGIQAGASSAIAAAQSVANQVAATVRKALDIHSPSRVMASIGGFVSSGLAKGILSAQRLVESASDALAFSAIPDQLATVSASGIVTSSVNLDDEEISRLKASASQTIIVEHKQVVPQVTVNVENHDSEKMDENELADKVADKIIEAMDSDLG